MTPDGMARHPSYRGIREDKPAAAVHAEIPAQVDAKMRKMPALRRRPKAKGRP
jgi:bifunctional non-homologous end joining protein LigD